jgi:hypothetical protein
MLRCFLKRLIDHAIYQLQEGHHRTRNQEKIAIKRKKVAYFYTTLHNSAKTYIVASTGIEPVSGASETLILSIVLRGHV